MASRIPLSVIVTTIEPWPDVSHLLDVLQPQVEAFGGEIIVAASDQAAPEEMVVSGTPRGRWLRRRDSTIPQLRALATGIARGEIIAMTEDDCLVAADWCAEVMHGFALHPLAKAIAGVTHDSTRFASDDAPRASRWSSVPGRPSTEDPNLLNSNIAYQRAVFPPATLSTGWIERQLNPWLMREGALVIHDQMVVHRVRQRGLPGRAVRLATGYGR